MKRLLILLLFMSSPWQLLSVQARTSGMPTIEVDFFTRLEKQLMDVVVAQDRAAMNSLLAPDFELRTSRNGGDLVLRDEWLQAVTTNYKVRSYRIEHLTVRQIDNAAIVNFFCEQQATVAGRDVGGEFFLVDVWQKGENDWKLLTRYSAGPHVNRHPNSNPKTRE